MNICKVATSKLFDSANGDKMPARKKFFDSAKGDKMPRPKKQRKGGVK